MSDSSTRNKYQEKCSSCGTLILPQRGNYIADGKKWKIHCDQCFGKVEVVSVSSSPTKEGIALLEKVHSEKSIYVLYIWKLLRKYFKYYLKGNKRNTVFEADIEEILYESISFFTERYLTIGDDFVKRSYRSTLFRIVFIKTMKHFEKKFDELWYEKLPKHLRGIVRPPSYEYHKNYWRENTLRINKRRRENYREIPSQREKRKQRYLTLKKDPIKYSLYLENVKKKRKIRAPKSDKITTQ